MFDTVNVPNLSINLNDGVIKLKNTPINYFSSLKL